MLVNGKNGGSCSPGAVEQLADAYVYWVRLDPDGLTWWEWTTSTPWCVRWATGTL